MAVIDGRGWTCEHVTPASGPCLRCRARIGDGTCPNCANPIDDHYGVGTPRMSCVPEKEAA